ncbi:thermonuclease family protein [Roseovarius salinarum]|uniref:thermonuclease family protein n=1 Tax=Roseovarius salinarum TaxID=1981892 RepID=UPI002FCD731E
MSVAASADPRGRIEVVDGDTLRVAGTTVRLHGIDAPEAGQPCRRPASGARFDCGAWVTDELRARFGGRAARCRARGQDRYGRTIASCTVDGTDIARWLVTEGLAFAYRRYSMAYDLAEKQAAVTGRGLHALSMQSPAAYRADQRPQGNDPPGDCRIKGNISADGTRIFHVPGQQHYARTVVRRADGERWFCSEAQARRAGWRKARR